MLGLERAFGRWASVESLIGSYKITEFGFLFVLAGSRNRVRNPARKLYPIMRLGITFFLDN